MIQASTFLKLSDRERSWNSPIEKPFNVQTDSRKVQKGDLFIALKGERFDAFQFIDQVLEACPAAVVFENLEEREKMVSQWAYEHPDVYFVGVASTLTFLQNLALEHRVWWGQGKKEVLGLTGSNGKTTTKEMLNILLRGILGDSLLCTQGNFNNHIGVPLTLLDLNEKHQFAIVEMGTSHSGEIADLCQIALPTCGLITNIGSAHIEYFQSPQNIFKEKRALYDSVMSSSQRSYFIVNLDDGFLKTLPIGQKARGFGRNAQDFRAEFNHEGLVLEFEERVRSIKNPHICGRHLYQNLGLALSLSILLFPEYKEALIDTAQELKLPSHNRGEWVKSGETQIFLDAYNANPNSMRASLETFSFQQKLSGTKPEDILYVLGDMNELGDLGHDFHRELGAFVSSLGAIHVYFIGHFAESYAEGFGDNACVFQTRQDAEKFYQDQGRVFKSVFLKASRSLQLESMTAIF